MSRRAARRTPQPERTRRQGAYTRRATRRGAGARGRRRAHDLPRAQGPRETPGDVGRRPRRCAARARRALHDLGLRGLFQRGRARGASDPLSVSRPFRVPHRLVRRLEIGGMAATRASRPAREQPRASRLDATPRQPDRPPGDSCWSRRSARARSNFGSAGMPACSIDFSSSGGALPHNCVHSPPFARCDAHFVDDLGGSQRYVLAVRVSSRVRLSETWRVLGRRDDLGALEAERRLLAQWAGHGKV